MSTLIHTAKHFGRDAVEIEGGLFVHMSALEHMPVNYATKSMSFPPLQLSDREMDRLRLPLANEEILKIKAELHTVHNDKVLCSYRFPE